MQNNNNLNEYTYSDSQEPSVTETKNKVLVNYNNVPLDELRSAANSNEDAMHEMILRSPLYGKDEIKLSEVKIICERELKKNSKNPYFNYVMGLWCEATNKNNLKDPAKYYSKACEDSSDKYGYEKNRYYQIADAYYRYGVVSILDDKHEKGCALLVHALNEGSSLAYSDFFTKKYIKYFQLDSKKNKSRLDEMNSKIISLSFCMFLAVIKNVDLRSDKDILQRAWVDNWNKNLRDVVIQALTEKFEDRNINEEGFAVNVLMKRAIEINANAYYLFVKSCYENKFITDHLYFELFYLLVKETGSVSLKNMALTDLCHYSIRKFSLEKSSDLHGAKRHKKYLRYWIKNMDFRYVASQNQGLETLPGVPDDFLYELSKKYMQAGKADLALSTLSKIKDLSVIDGNIIEFFQDEEIKAQPRMDVFKLNFLYMLALQNPSDSTLRNYLANQFGSIDTPTWKVNHLIQRAEIVINTYIQNYQSRATFNPFHFLSSGNLFQRNSILLKEFQRKLENIKVSHLSEDVKLNSMMNEVTNMRERYSSVLIKDVGMFFVSMQNHLFNINEEVKKYKSSNHPDHVSSSDLINHHYDISNHVSNAMH